MCVLCALFCFKQKTAYDMRISDWSSDVCSSYLDKKYQGEPTRLEIGDGNMVREYVTINTGTAQDVGVTRLKDDNWIMAYVHIAHDCQIGSHTVIANSVQLAGHIHIGDWAILGGLTAVPQFVSLGAHTMKRGTSPVRRDLTHYTIGHDEPFRPEKRRSG